MPPRPLHPIFELAVSFFQVTQVAVDDDTLRLPLGRRWRPGERTTCFAWSGIVSVATVVFGSARDGIRLGSSLVRRA